jgi:hypothetical protein
LEAALMVDTIVQLAVAYSSGDNDVLGQGGLEQVVWNNDQPQVQHDVAAKNFALDWSNAAQSNHC